MSERIFRVKIRGLFDQLTDEQRTALLDDAAEHDMLKARFATEGNLTYDLAARPFFTFRYLDSGETAEDIGPATERALAAAQAWLDERGYGYRDLKADAEDMSEASLGKRQKRNLAKQ